MSAPWTIDGRRAFITGGARGIGLETGRALAARGVRVALVDVDGAELERAAAGVPGAVAFVADVTDRAALDAAVAGAVEALGGIDIVVANAGIAASGPLRLADPAAFEKTIDVNVVGVFRTVHATIDHVIAARGYVLAIASSAAVIHAPGLGAYVTSKAAVEALSNVLRLELAPHGVDVGCGYFTFLDTEMVRGGHESGLFAVLEGAAPRFVTKTYPLRLGIDAIVRGIERRSRLVYAPRFLRPAIALRTLVTRVGERQMRRAVVPLDESFAREAAERGLGEASRPVGAGGAAAVRADARRVDATRVDAG